MDYNSFGLKKKKPLYFTNMLISQLPIISEKRKKTEMIEKRVVFELIREAFQWGSQTSASILPEKNGQLQF